VWHLFCFFQYVLAVGSSVFGAMFYGDLAEGESEIHIPDVEPAAFLILLKYVLHSILMQMGE